MPVTQDTPRVHRSVGGGSSGSKVQGPRGKAYQKTPKDDEKCTLGADPDKTVPDYYTFLEGSYTLQVEMTSHITSMTYYIQETREVRDLMQREVNAVSVRITTNATQEIVYFYPLTRKFVTYKNGACEDHGMEDPFAIWGWFDEDPEHGDEPHYGPSSILRLTHFVVSELYTANNSVFINDVLSNGWKMCSPDGDVELFFYYSVPEWEMPNTPNFSEENTQFPVYYSARSMSGSFSFEYSISQFVPYVVRHTELEPPRGANCEAMVGVLGDFPIPSMPNHFSFQQETITNPMIEGQQLGVQIVDKSLLYYSQNLSLIRFDFVPAYEDETPFMSEQPLRVIQDFNTGVSYFIDLENGNCTRTWLDGSFHHHTHGFFGSGEMVGPDEFMKLTGTWAYVGPFFDRHIEDHRWTSTRNDIVNPETGGVYNKAVIEWEFLFVTSDTDREEGASATVPVRTNLYVYNQEDTSKVDFAITTNVYSYTAISLYSEDEFDVFQCYERSEFDWSFLLFVFPTSDEQFAAIKSKPDLVRHQLYDGIMRFGQVSPVRISSIDVSDGFSGMGGNHTDTNIVLATVRFLERAPYIFSYGRDDSAPSVPGQNEKKLAYINNPRECAEFCSRNRDFDCKSFQVCDQKDCYLSKSVDQDGDPVTGVESCEHWVLTMENITFADLPSNRAYEEIRRAAHDGEFSLIIENEGKEVVIPASEVFHYRNPDFMALVTDQFFLVSRHSQLNHPNNSYFDIANLEECEALCLSIQEYRCDSLAYSWENLACHLSSLHFDAFQAGDIVPMSHSAVITRSYLTEYKPVFGGVSLNSSGPVYQEITHMETCAMKCSTESSIDCRSFDFCFEEKTCRLHTEGFLDGTTGGNYNIFTACTHFSRSSRDDFTEYNNQALPSSQHRLILSDTTAATCAKQCIDDTTEVCESFDFCEMCEEAEEPTCGSEGLGKMNACFLSTKHLGEDDVSLLSVVACQHYERDYFGELSYAAWKNQQLAQEEDRYGSGDMAGLAFGMIFLGILLSVGFLYAMAYARRSNMPSIPMTFTNLRRKAGESRA